MANTRPTPSFPTTLGSEGRTGYIPWMRYKSFMLIGACSTPISTWPAAGAGGSGRSASSRTIPGSPKALICRARILAPPVSVIAEFDEVATGERTPGLLQAATRRETAEIHRREAETLDELFDECGRFGMVSRDEDHATSSVLDRPFIEAGGDDRIERLDDAGTWRQGRHDLARALAAEVGEDELRTRLDEGIRRIDEHPAVPGGEALQRRLDVSPGHGQQHVVEARGFLDRGRGRTTTQLGDRVDECSWTTPAAQDHFMAPGQRLSPECERDSAGADRSKFHAPLLSFEKSMRTTPARPARPTCASASAIRDGTERSATSNSAGFCASCSARATSALRWWGGCRSQLLIATPLSVSDRGGNRRMSLVSPPSDPLTTVPVPFARRSATSSTRRPPILSMATWILVR